jgi:hypothetical protein
MTTDDELRSALDACLSEGRTVPMQRTLGSGFAIQNVTVVAVPVERWEALVRAIDHELARSSTGAVSG